jgi:hypothetical protein
VVTKDSSLRNYILVFARKVINRQNALRYLYSFKCRGDYRRVLDWLIGFIDTFYTYTTRDCRQYSAIADLHTLEFTVTHALGLTVFTSRIRATDLWQSHCNFKSHMKASVPQPDSFLAISSQLPLTAISRTQLNSRPEPTHMNFSSTKLSQILTSKSSLGTSRYIASERTPRKTPSSIARLVLGVFADPLPRNRRPIFARVGSHGNVFTESLPSYVTIVSTM